jgi:hypothetical protein
MSIVWLRRASVVLTVLLVACGGRSSPTTSAAGGGSLASRMLSGDDVPAGFRPLPLAADVTRRWCGTGSLNTPTPRQHKSQVLVSEPDGDSQAVVTDTVMVFAPGDAARFVAALRTDSLSSNRPKIVLPTGVSIEGDHFEITLSPVGDEQLVTDVRGVARGPSLPSRCGGALARIVVRRGNVVVVIEDVAAGVQLDTGFRNRLARRAGDQAELGA